MSRLSLLSAALLTSLVCWGCGDLPLDPGGEQDLEIAPLASWEPGYCHRTISTSLCAELWMLFEDLEATGFDGCGTAANFFLMHLEAGNIRYNPDVWDGAETDMSTGIISLGPSVYYGTWDKIYLGVHETRHARDGFRHQCQWGEWCRPDEADYSGLDCANQFTGENRQWNEE